MSAAHRCPKCNGELREVTEIKLPLPHFACTPCVEVYMWNGNELDTCVNPSHRVALPPPRIAKNKPHSRHVEPGPQARRLL